MALVTIIKMKFALVCILSKRLFILLNIMGFAVSLNYFAKIGDGPCYYHWNEIYAGVCGYFWNGICISNSSVMFCYPLRNIQQPKHIFNQCFKKSVRLISDPRALVAKQRVSEIKIILEPLQMVKLPFAAESYISSS